METYMYASLWTMLALGVFSAGYNIYVLLCYSRAKGVISGFSERTFDGKRERYPIVEFTTAEGTLINFRSNRPINFRKHGIGTDIHVLYSPRNVKKAIINSLETLWLLPLILLLMGSAVLIPRS